MSDSDSQEEDLAPSEFTTVKGSMCKIFRTDLKPERVFHKSMGVINPVPDYEDPRKTIPTPHIEPKVKRAVLGRFSTKYKEKSFLPEHLTSPFIYIERLVQKDGTGLSSAYHHPDQWNTSINVSSTRLQTQIPKHELNELTLSVVASKRDPTDKNDYEQNERLKKYVKFFFKEIQKLLKDKRFNQELAMELLHPRRALHSSHSKSKQNHTKSMQSSKDASKIAQPQKQQSKSVMQKEKSTQMDYSSNPAGNPKQPAGEFVELDRDYQLREIWAAFCSVKKISFDGGADDQQIIELSVFRDFVRGLGYLEKKWSEIDKYFDYFNKKEEVGLVHPGDRHEGSVERDQHEDPDNQTDSPLKASKGEFGKNSSLLQWRPAVKKLQKSTFSMKAFIYNFEKYIKELDKIPYVLSERAAVERRVSFRHTITNFFATYKETKSSVNTLRDMEDECKVAIKAVAAEFDDVDVKREMEELNQYEETIKKGHKFSREEKTQLEAKIAVCKEKTQQAMEKFNELCGIGLNHFQSLCNESDRLFFEKRVIMRFLKKLCESPDLLVFTMVEDAVANRMAQIDSEVDTIAIFYEHFMDEKDAYDEKAMKLYEIANYIHENNFTRSELDIVTYFVRKIKANYNVSREVDKSTTLNPNQFISLDVFKKTYNIYREKRDHEIKILDKLLDNCRDQLDAKMPTDTIERVRQKIEYNMMYDFFQKIFDDYESQAETLYKKITNVIQFVFSELDNTEDQQNLYVSASNSNNKNNDYIKINAQNQQNALAQPKFKNKMSYLIWGIFDRSDEYLPREIKEKIETKPVGQQQAGRYSTQYDKANAISDILGGFNANKKDQDEENDHFFSKMGGSVKPQIFGSIAQSDEDVYSPFQNNFRKTQQTQEDEDDFAIDILNNRNGGKQQRFSKQSDKQQFLNDNDISEISELQYQPDKRRKN